MKTYSNRIRELRLAKSLNQEQLAEKIGLTKQAISQYERGDRKPSLDVIEALCDFFNVSADYLLGKDEVTLRFVNGDDLRKLEDKNGYYVDGETAQIAQEIFEDPNKRALFNAARDSRPEDLQMAANMLERFKESNPDG